MKNKIDLQKIADELGFDLDDIEMLIDVFIESSIESLENIKNAIKTNDYEMIFESAHSIKGSAANLRLAEISQIANTIEIESKNKKSPDYMKLVTDLHNLIKSIK